MRVEIMIDGLGWGGAEMLLTEFAATAGSAGLDLSVSYLREKDGNPAAARLRALGVDPVMVPIGGLLAPASLRSVRRHLAATRPDVLHTHLGYSDFLGGLAARSLGIPTVSTIHVTEWEGDLRNAVKLYLSANVRARCMSRVIAVSESARQAYMKQGWDRRDHFAVVRNGVVGATQPGSGRSVRAELLLAPDHLVVAMVSVLRPGKGHEVALEAVRRLQVAFPQLRLLIVGEGPLRGEIERRAAPLGSAVVMAGHRDDIMRVLDAVDVLVHPSHADAFPTALLEAAAAGVPVVATRVGGIPEIVVPGQTGLLVDAPPDADTLAPALGFLLTDPAKRQRLALAARQRFGQLFTAQAWSSNLRALYEELLEEQRAGPHLVRS